MKIKSFTFNTFQENTYIVYDNSNECIIIDPGCYSEGEQEELKKFIIKQNLNPVKLINTHCHIDHILGNQFIINQWGVELYIHKADLPMLESAENIAKMYGFENYAKSPFPEHFLEENDIIKFGESNFKILFTPGHAPGHICLHNKKNNLLIGGDLIFKGSIGRTDLPGGNYEILIQSIKNKIFPLSNDTKIFCGHGPSTNIGHEKETNPFLV